MKQLAFEPKETLGQYKKGDQMSVGVFAGIVGIHPTSISLRIREKKIKHKKAKYHGKKSYLIERVSDKDTILLLENAGFCESVLERARERLQSKAYVKSTIQNQNDYEKEFSTSGSRPNRKKTKKKKSNRKNINRNNSNHEPVGSPVDEPQFNLETFGRITKLSKKLGLKTDRLIEVGVALRKAGIF